MSERTRVYAYLDGLDELRLETQTRTAREWAASCDTHIMEIVSEPFIKRMKYAALDTTLSWCVTYGAGLVVARTDFLSTQMKFLKRVHKSGVNIYSADLVSLRGTSGMGDSVQLWRLLYEIGTHRSYRVSAMERMRIAQRLNASNQQQQHDAGLMEEVYYAVRNDLTDRALALYLNDRGRLQINGNRFTKRAAIALRRRVLKMLEAR